MLVKVLRFAAGIAAGIAVWLYATPAYNDLLAGASQPVLRIDGKLRNAFVAADARTITVTGPDLPPVRLPADQLTYNIILLCGLFATLPLRRRSLIAFLISLAILGVTHVLAVVASAEATFGRAAGGSVVWTAIEYAYRLAGMFAIAFACWWVALDGGPGRAEGVLPVARGESARRTDEGRRPLT